MKKLVRFFAKLIVWFLILSIGGVLLFRFVPVYFTPLMGIRTVESLVQGKSPRLHHKWVPYDHISDHLKRAVIASEDQRFYLHRGFDRVEIEKALKENKTRRKARGASTISQQTAKNLFLWPRSSWFRKGLEAYFTLLIEWMWPKDRILEVYLNSMETGKGIYGAEAVARLHFNTTAKKLSPSQSALIAATLPNPRVYSSKNPSAYMQRRQAHILNQMWYVRLPKD
ncbi:MAG: monofunctional biosynthetic peptidoglycan transglycosylase [Porphyromonadaceae bacterium]|nr:monofunctional biosynthetic peptidoglycan transglycosylase [Porphyromonadaceae bacterium]